ncbi:MAG: hypothetical protein ACOC4L_05010 [Halanaerobium sp.]
MRYRVIKKIPRAFESERMEPGRILDPIIPPEDVCCFRDCSRKCRGEFDSGQDSYCIAELLEENYIQSLIKVYKNGRR